MGDTTTGLLTTGSSMTPEPKRLRESPPDLDAVEEFMLELERRQFDRRKSNRFKQISQWATVAGLCISLGACTATVAARLGWRLLGTPDDVIVLQKDMVAVKADVEGLKRNHDVDRVYIQFLVVARCLELTEKEAVLLSATPVKCTDVLNRANLRNLPLPTGSSP